jgi:NhaA family Na+:H+ antiporter
MSSARSPSVAARVFDALERFLHIEAVSGIVLLAAALAALLWANSPLAGSYQELWHAPLTFGAGAWVVAQPLHFWINDGLMTIFFLVVGLEIRREMHEGTLANLQVALLPLAAALGGVILPALIYLSISGAGIARQGWAIPTATDIAFAVGILALLGKSVPAALRVLLLALAVIDDIAAVIVIALFYSGGLAYLGFLVAAGGMLLVLCWQRLGFMSAFA